MDILAAAAYGSGMSQGTTPPVMAGCVERPIRFVHRGRITEVAGADTTRTLLDWLREDARCSGHEGGLRRRRLRRVHRARG